MKPIIRRKLLKQSYTSYVNKCHAIILIYGDDNTYEVAKADELFASKLPRCGSLTSLYKSVFLQTLQNDPSVDAKYDSFIELLKDINNKTSCDDRQLRILITLGFFSDFGENGKLLKIMELFLVVILYISLRPVHGSNSHRSIMKVES